MADQPDYRELMGFGEPLLSVQVDDSQVFLHRKEAEGLAKFSAPMRSLHLWVSGSNRRGGAEIPEPWGGTVVGDQQIICGEMPSGAVTVEATVDESGPIPVQIASDVWLIVAPCAKKAEIIFRNSEGRSIRKLEIGSSPTEQDITAMIPEWLEDPDYTPDIPPAQSEGSRKTSRFEADIKRYGLGEPLLTVPVGEGEAALYRQQATGMIWHSIDCSGGTFGPIDDSLVYQATTVGRHKVILGPIPPSAVIVEAMMSGGQQLPVYSTAGVFLVVAPSLPSATVTFSDSGGSAVGHRIEVP